ncbi:MAG: AAA family ATPase, partial [Chloroflexi bacterium]|nr:AAA family ATPase [Chloroflexota bacterium]
MRAASHETVPTVRARASHSERESFGQQVRDAVTHAYDFAYLQVHPLAALLPTSSHTSAPAGQRLQRLLFDTIERLDPGPGAPATAKAWRTYRLLKLRHAEGLDAQAVCAQLGISRREYSREHTRGLDAIASLLAPELLPGPDPAATGAVNGNGRAAPAVEPDGSGPGNAAPEIEPASPVSPASTAKRAPIAAVPAQTPLVGRDGELQFLRDAFDAVALSGRGRLIFIGGEPGVGKTRLAREVGEYTLQQGGLFLKGHHRREAAPPYLAWAEALRACLLVLSQNDLAEVVGPYGAEVARIVPEVARALPSVDGSAGPTLTPDEQRWRFYDGVAAVLQNLARRAPLVLVLDDIQWAPGLLVLSHVARRLETCRVLIIGAYRDYELHEHAGLARDWAELNRSRLSTDLALRPLDAEQTAQIVAHHFGVEPAAQLGDSVYQATRGNPFFVEEVVRSLVENGTVRPSAAGHSERVWQVSDASGVKLPASVRLLVEERISRLGPQAQGLLTQAAVLGHEFNFPALQAMTGWAEDGLVDEIERALASGLLVDRSTPGEERYAFADSHVREALYADLSGPRRRRLHRRAGQAIETVYGNRVGAHVEDLALHFTQSNEVEKGAAYAHRAGTRADQVFAWHQAAHWYQKALALWEQHGDQLEQRCDTALALGQALLGTGEPGPAVEAAAEAVRLAEALGDGSRILRTALIAIVGLVRCEGRKSMASAAFRRWAELADRHA